MPPSEPGRAVARGRAPVPEPDWELERRLWEVGRSPVAGIDEAGRGALAGPVTAAAVILPYGRHPFRDSKTVGRRQREELADAVRAVALAWGVGEASPEEIDRLGIVPATRLAARRALAELRERLAPEGLVTDALDIPTEVSAVAVPRADARSFQAAAASLLAKTARDATMLALGKRFPGYGFERHKGYGVPRHLRALAELGPSPVHRRSFRPVTSSPLFLA